MSARLRRKLIELELARRLERTLTKQQILETYLNVIYLGNGTYGVEAASRDLFGKSVRRLSLAEAATLAGLREGSIAVRAPAAPRPSAGAARPGAVAHGAARATSRPSSRRATRQRTAPDWPRRNGGRPGTDHTRSTPFARRWIRCSAATPRTAGDLVVHSTLDAEAQQAAERAVRDTGAAIQRQASGLAEGARLEGAVVALDPRTGEIRALVGGRRYGSRAASIARWRPAAAGVGFQALRVRRGARGRLQPRHHPRRLSGRDRQMGAGSGARKTSAASTAARSPCAAR